MDDVKSHPRRRHRRILLVEPRSNYMEGKEKKSINNQMNGKDDLFV